MTIDERKALADSARAATPGPWEKQPGRLVVSPCKCCGLIAECSQFGADPECSNADYIAMANPKAILELLAMLDEMEARSEGLEKVWAGLNVSR